MQVFGLNHIPNLANNVVFVGSLGSNAVPMFNRLPLQFLLRISSSSQWMDYIATHYIHMPWLVFDPRFFQNQTKTTLPEWPVKQSSSILPLPQCICMKQFCILRLRGFRYMRIKNIHQFPDMYSVHSADIQSMMQLVSLVISILRQCTATQKWNKIININ